MKIFVLIGMVVLMFFAPKCYGESHLLFDNDTAWVVNCKYTPERDTFRYVLDIPVRHDSLAQYEFIQIFWGDSLGGKPLTSGVLNYDDTKSYHLSHKYSKGIYPLLIRFYKVGPGEDKELKGDKEVPKIVFNQRLTGKISVKDSDGCMENGVDTFRIYLSQHKTNPPGTKYTVDVKTDAPGENPWKVEPVNQSEIKDSAMVIFSGPTGTLGAIVCFKMSYREAPTSIQCLQSQTDWTQVNVYKTPDIKEIFRFRDTLTEGETLENFQYIEVCTGNELAQISYDSMVNAKYMYEDGLPVYSSRFNFQVDYYRKDSLSQKAWENVTQDSAIIDTANMIFKYPGFYKIRMVAYNECGLDSLHTDSIRNLPDKRYIKVYQSGVDMIFCDQDTICGVDRTGVGITFVDRGKRFAWDSAPEYDFKIGRKLNGVPMDSVLLGGLAEITLYKDGHVLPNNYQDQVECDSSLIKIKLFEAGTYNISLSRTRFCEPELEYLHTVTIGDVPVLPSDTLWTQLGTDVGRAIHFCDTFLYTLPQIRIDSNNMWVDSVQWCFTKKTNLDTVYQVIGKEQIFKFDSIGNHRNYISLRAHNHCGWSLPEKAELYTDTKPKVVLWRDSLQKNDSLCVDIDYKYYFVGDLPSRYSIYGNWDKGPVDVNDKTLTSGGNHFLASTTEGYPRVGKVKYGEKQKKVYETFRIWNQLNTACEQILIDSASIVSQPETIIYTDTIHHCDNFTKLDANMLFGHNLPEFRYVMWKLNGGPIIKKNQDQYDEIFTLRSDVVDTLYVKTGNSGGCYLERSIILNPLPQPELELNERQKAVCAEDSILPVNYTDDYIKVSNIGNVPGISLKIYNEKVEQSRLVYDTTGSVKIRNKVILNQNSPDTVHLIYKMQNDLLTPGFGDCWLKDTVSIKVWKSELHISGCDTVRDVTFTKYDFSQMGMGVRIDTADIQNGLITWKVIEGSGAFMNSNDLETIYTLSNTDKNKDSLLFELSGKTPCGKELKDSLIVYLPKEKLFAHVDTICMNSGAYKLWDPKGNKTTGEFIDPASLVWNLLPGKGGEVWGSLTPSDGIGANVIFVPNANAWKADTVKIVVKAWNLYDPGHTRIPLLDTVYLKISHFPVNIYPDTLYMDAALDAGRRIRFEDIKVFRSGISGLSDGHFSRTIWDIKRTEGLNATFEMNGGVVFYIGEPQKAVNYAADMNVLLKAEKGCPSLTAKVVLQGILDPGTITSKSLELCDGGSIRVDSAYTIPNMDKFTKIEYKHNGTGRFIESGKIVEYQSGQNDDISEYGIIIKKKFALYNGNIKEYKPPIEVPGRIHLFRQPSFTLRDGATKEFTHDTLCVNDNIFYYPRNWVDGNFDAANYTEAYLVAKKSTGIVGNFPDFTLVDGVNEAKFIVTTDFGSCKKWEDIGDTIFITRLPQMTGSFEVPTEICAGSQFTVTDVKVDGMCKDYSWSFSGGTIDQTDIARPVFTSKSSGLGAVVMWVIPPHNCPDTKSFTKTLNVLEKPSLVLTDMTVCKGSGFMIDFTKHPQTQSIAWKANGRLFATTTTESSVSYVFNLTDVTDGVIKIIGEITPLSPCTDKILSNVMTVTLQDFPKISGSLVGSVCQGDSLSLSEDIVEVVNQSDVLWSLNGGGGEFEDVSIVNTRYFPGEISGNVILTITAEGLNGCPSVSENVKVAVSKSELPVLNEFPTKRCVGSEVIFSHQVSAQPGGATAKWYVDGHEKAQAWYQFRHTFATAGDYQIRLITTYNGSCSRSVERSVTINPLPATNFKSLPDSIVGSGQEIRFTNLTPQTDLYHWDFYGRGTPVSDDGTTCIHRYDLADKSFLFTGITLTVTDVNQCSASKTRSLKVVSAPTAKFKITDFDKCKGNITFENLSLGENISYLWDLGNGVVLTDTLPRNVVYTPVAKDSTYHIVLTVKSEAGESVHRETVKVVSTLSSRFTMSPDKEGCEGKQMAKGFSNRTVGDAELYTFSWGDGTPDHVYTEFYPTSVLHKFDNPGTTVKTYKIYLTAVNACHTEVYEDSIRISPNKINTQLIPDKTRVCFGNEITFRNESFGYLPDMQAWWFFEPGVPPISTNEHEVVHRFNKPGSYPVKLVMTDPCNSDTSEIVQVQILGDLSLAFGVEDGPYCTRQKIEMKVLPELKNRFTAFSWNFGDAWPENAVDSVGKRYNASGIYQVRLSAYSVSEGNCPITTKNTTIVVNETPAALITPINELMGCTPYTVSKFARVGSGTEQILWDFKNGETSSESVVTDIVFSEAGDYPVSLELISVEGCVDTTTRMVRVKESPLPLFTVSDSLFCTSDENVVVNINNQTSVPDRSSFEWSYEGKAPFSRAEQPGSLSLPNEAGEIQIKLHANHKITGCQADRVQKIILGRRVRASVEMDTSLCVGEMLTGKSTAENADVVDWDMGDGGWLKGENLNYTYGVAGRYYFRMLAANEDGCRDSVRKSVRVYPLPVADFSYMENHIVFNEGEFPKGFDISKLPEAKNGGIGFMNHSYVEPFDFMTEQLQYYWNFGDGSAPESAKDPQHRYKNNGQYIVTLRVEAEHGCKDSISDNIAVEAVKGLFIPNAFAPGTGIEENPGTALFQPKGIGLMQYQIQIFDQWGACVWSSDKLVEGRPVEAWDGTFKGVLLPKGMYLWNVVSAIFMDGSVWTNESGHTKGRVMLIR